MRKKNVLIIGKLPPPIGGVTVHVSRLLSYLQKEKYSFDFLQLSSKNLIKLLFYIRRYKCIHIHSSNPFAREYVTIIAKVLKVKSVVTFHGDLGRYSSNYKNRVDNTTIRLSDKPIVLNEQSFIHASSINKNCDMVSAFIPPDIKNEYLKSECIKTIEKFKAKYKIVFCTNAYNLSYDKNNNEIYGIFEIVEIFRNRRHLGLVFSDPSGMYSKEFYKRNIVVPENVLVINEEHSFFRVVCLCDVNIRNTTTDGDSLSVKESLYLHKITLATNVVSRPKGCLIYNIGTLGNIIDQLNKEKLISKINNDTSENSVSILVSIYNKLSSSKNEST